MNENRDNKGMPNGKKAVKCTPVDWDSYKIKKEEAEHHSGRKGKQGWEQPVVTDKWALDKTVEDKPAYDFCGR